MERDGEIKLEKSRARDRDKRGRGRATCGSSSSSSSRAIPVREPIRNRVPLTRLLRVASVAGGIQFGWALQLSLLTPYVQELGIPHAWASMIWLCGPLSGFFVQPLVGLLSDRCTSRFGRRTPFIVAGASMIVVSVLIVGHAADIGGLLGDTPVSRPRAIVAFIVGFWLLDMANNTTQGPIRALLADLTGKDHRRTRVANAYYSLFMAVGNTVGYATGSYDGWYKVLRFTLTRWCDVSCANLKSAFLLDVVFVAATAYVSVSAAKETPLAEDCGGARDAFLWELTGMFRYLPGPVWVILAVTVLNSLGWFPFFLFDTDWMGREIYGGAPGGGAGAAYGAGVRAGAFGLMLNSVLLGLTSVLMEKLCRKFGAGLVWGVSNVFMSLCFLSMLLLSSFSTRMDYWGASFPPPTAVVTAAMLIFALLGIPLAITYSVPYALVSTRIEALGLGQGLSMGVLNVAIVIPQTIVAVGSGPWDQMFGGGNSPALAMGAAASFAGGLIAILLVRRSTPTMPRTIK